ncbi:ribosomal protein S6 modification enzyme (RimK) [Alkalihalophilus pseudofirmus OF4]|uniref:Ribosomal protein S6 modification enzyme (RimK) n=1 Tax=Alkalihalophilus pseudofirmus (strain ATCC BAA-2126 / JCM 17055 / OF4) TaxID=398511 RepID=D3FU35_ALKPO|nr:RimK family alpha-L-glutamate ligase [Alkalihalophilus pseudofirmus]ADC48237.1 ribosomal protein S6 modification enzyme (RimK) [Alkalihalophilus pseudofirmus OF4]
MKFVTFNPFRTIGIPGIQYVKPEHLFSEREKIDQADVCLFPENWQVNALVYGMKKPIFPSIQSIQLGFNKVEVTRALWSVCPGHVPYTQILGHSEDSIQKILQNFPFPFVAKEIRNSMGNGVFLIHNEEELREYAENNPTMYIQEYLEIDRDLRVCFVGDEVIASYWRINESNSFHNNVAKGGKISFDNIPQEAIELVTETASALGIDHAGFDLVFANDQFYFLEFNTLFGNQGFQQLGISIEQKIYKYLQTKHSTM